MLLFYVTGFSCSGGLKAKCEGGSYSAGGASVCLPCSEGSVSSSGAAYCNPCATGMYTSSPEGPCMDCEASYYCVGGVRKSCPIGMVSTPKATACAPCPAGSYCRDNQVILCLSGYQCSNGIQSSCSAGTYSLEGSSFCTTCDAGTYADVNHTSCIDCEKGNYCLAGIKKPCSEGTFAESKQVYCSLCPSGSECFDNVVTPCTPGYYCINGKRSACSLGTYSLGGNASCTVCNAGSYTSEEGATSCESCTDGHICENGVLKDCLPGSYCTKGGAKDCPPGSYSDGGLVTSCSRCKQGSYNPSTGAKSKSDCILCPINMITRSTGSSVDTDCGCDFGYYTIYDGSNSPTCTECKDDLICDSFNMTLYDVKPATDYYVVGILTSGVATIPCPTGACNNSQCTANYEGFLCSKCRTGTYKEGSIQKEVHCTTCETPFLPSWNYFQAILSMILGWGVVAFQVYTRRKRMFELVHASSSPSPSDHKGARSTSATSTARVILSSGSSKSIVMKLIVNYMQVITIVGNFKIQWSSSVKSMFGVTNILSSGGNLESAGFSLSGGLKCLLYSNNFPLPMNELMMALLLFIVTTIVIVTFWFSYYLCRTNKSDGQGVSSIRTEAITVSLLVMAYNSYPKFIRGFFQLFSCTYFPGEMNKPRLVGSLDTICYGSDHFWWFLILGLPVLVVIVIGFPATGLWKLRREDHRGNLNSQKILSTVGFLYDGKTYIDRFTDKQSHISSPIINFL